MSVTANPDYETLKFLMVIAGALISLLLLIIGFFLSKQIDASKAMTLAVNELTGSVNTMAALEKERHPVTVKRLNDHSETLKNHERRIIKIESRCNLKHNHDESDRN